MEGHRLGRARAADGNFDRVTRPRIPPQFVELGVGGEVFAVEGDDLVADAEPSAFRGTTRDDIEDRDVGRRRVEIVFMIEADFNRIGRTANGVHPGKCKEGCSRAEKGRDGKKKWTRERGPRT